MVSASCDKPSEKFLNRGRRALVLGLLLSQVLSASGEAAAGDGSTPAAALNRPSRAVEGSILEIVLEPMPEKYQSAGGMPMELFTASPDSIFWCGPNKPNPYSWLSRAVILRKRADFQIQLCTAAGDSIEVLDFVGVLPAVYHVNLSETKRPNSGIYILRFLYNGMVVRESRVHFVE
jgi:hypothetical protein